jgi:hypothetical protein
MNVASHKWILVIDEEADVSENIASLLATANVSTASIDCSCIENILWAMPEYDQVIVGNIPPEFEASIIKIAKLWNLKICDFSSNHKLAWKNMNLRRPPTRDQLLQVSFNAEFERNLMI